MAPIVIVGAMIGAGVGGVISARRSGSPWGGALLGAAGGALAGWGAGALGLGGGIAAGSADALSTAGSTSVMQPMSGVASVGAAAPAASTVAPATSVLSSISTNSPFTSAATAAPTITPAANTASSAGGLFSGIETSDLTSAGLGVGSNVASLLTTPEYPEETTIMPNTIAAEDVKDTGPSLRALTAEELATRNARRKALADRYRDVRIAEGAQSAAALAAIRNAYEDPRAYLRTAPSTLARQQGALTGVGGFRFNTV